MQPPCCASFGTKKKPHIRVDVRLDRQITVARALSLPVPLPEAPALALDGQRPDIARSRLEGVQRPAPGQNGVGWRPIEERETLAPSFHVGLFFCPTAEKGLGVEIAREPVETVTFSRREEAPRDFGPRSEERRVGKEGGARDARR